MSVLLETSLGDIVIDLHTDLAPRSCTNFLKLCSKHYYKLNAFFRVEKDFLAQTGDPTNTGKGGASIWSQLPSISTDRSTDTYFRPETSRDQLQHTKKGTVSFACFRKQAVEGADEQTDLVAGSQFFITLKDEIDYLDGKHAPFGIVVEGQEPGGTLDKINEAYTDDQKRPLKDIRIRHVVVLEDPFLDPDGFIPPSRSPSPTPSQIRSLRLADDEDLTNDLDDAAKEESRRKTDTNAAALTLEMVGDLPFAEIRPPENILFVCKLNPVTRSDDLELIFSRFGKILSCEVIKDKKTGDSLQYAFIEFDKKDDAERAYFKMQNVLVDDRRIWVDFSQSVSRLHGDWVKKRNGGREAPRGRYEWQQGKAENGGRVDSYRPRGERGQNGSGSSRERAGRDDRDRNSASYHDDRRQPQRDQHSRDSRHRDAEDHRERAHKRSRREDDDRSKHSSHRQSSSRTELSSAWDHQARDGDRGSHRRESDRPSCESRSRHDRLSERRHEEDGRHRESASRRHTETRDRDRDDGKERERDRHHRRDEERRRDDDRRRHRDDSLR